jgi:hypothetical protein
VAVGLSVGEANKLLDAIARGVTYVPPSAFWLQLHSGDPGASGTANIAGNATRKQVTFGNATANAEVANTVAVSWSAGEVDTSESYPYFSGWSASSGGVFVGSGLASGVVTAGMVFTLPVGSVSLALPVAS